MAITKIHGIKATVDKAIDYICNPDKTDDKIFISSFACAPETAALDFKYTLDHTTEHSFADGQDKENKAFHLIQAFEPGEVSFEEAHAIGKELADKLLEGKYSYVLTTHIDKGHVHNHLIFCAADNIDYAHYHDCKQSYYRIRNISDKLCQEHGLSVIEPDGKRGMKYNEWAANKKGKDWKPQIRKDINQAIKASSTYEDFLALMKAKGYKMTGTALDGDARKYITFQPLGRDRAVRGSVKSLGKNFTREQIKERIENRHLRTASLRQSDKKTLQMIDMVSDPKFAENMGLQKWATKENLKIAAKTFSLMSAKNIHNFAELDARIITLQEQAKAANGSIVLLEGQIRDIAETIKYAEQYRENKPFNERYEHAKDQDKFLRKYESHLILFDGAKRMLQRKGTDLGHLNLSKMKATYQELLDKKKDLTARHTTAQSETKQLEQIRKNMAQYLELYPKTDQGHDLNSDASHNTQR